MSSLRTRLTATLLLATVPPVILVGAGLFQYVRSSLTARFDDGLLARSMALRAAAVVDRGELEFNASSEQMPGYGPGGSEFFSLRAVRGGEPGELIRRSDSLGSGDLEAIGSGPEPVVWDGPLPSGRAGRLLAVRFRPTEEAESHADEQGGAMQPPPGTPVSSELMLVVACPRDGLDRTLGVIRGGLIGAGLLLVGAMSLAAVVGLTRALRPVSDLTEQVNAIDPARGGGRVGGRDVPAELAPIVDRINALVGRMEEALEREKRTSSSLAHELRTPVAEIRAVTELALSRDRAPADYRCALDDVLETALRMESSVAALLRLSRVQCGREAVELTQVEVSDVLAPILRRLERTAADRGIRLQWPDAPPCSVHADPQMLAVVLENLAANAARYTPDDGRIQCEVRHAGGEEVEVVLRNSAGEADPPAGESGLGLGLTLCSNAASAMGGLLEAKRTGTEFVARVRLSGAGSALTAAK